MKILIDLISVQGYINGGAEYCKALYSRLLTNIDVELYGLYDSNMQFCGDDEQIFVNSLVEIIDINNVKLSDYIIAKNIKVFFIGIIQRYVYYDLSEISCDCICVCHDIGNIEIAANRIYTHYPITLRSIINYIFDNYFPTSSFSTYNRILRSYKSIIRFMRQDNVKLITVSQYTLNSIKYYISELKHKEITCLYPPLIFENIVSSENLLISSKVLALKGKKYLLLLNADRDNKISSLIYSTFSQIVTAYPDLHLVTTGGTFLHENVVNLGFVNSNELRFLYMNSYLLLYPSYSEGFGFPPIEAMKYNVPSIVSNVCSMPEVLSKSVAYFSPFYAHDFFRVLSYVYEHRSSYVKDLPQYYEKIKMKSHEDFNSLVKLILNINNG